MGMDKEKPAVKTGGFFLVPEGFIPIFCAIMKEGVRVLLTRNRWKIATLICVAVFFIAFLILHSSGQSKHLSVAKASSMQDVKQFQYEHVPGLERAEKLGLTKSYQVKQPIPKAGRTLKIGEVWYSSGFAYVFYSIDALPLKKPSDPQAVSAGLPSVSCAVSPSKSKQVSVCTNQDRGILYDGRLFRFIRFSPFKNDKGNKFLSKVTQITLKRMDVSIGENDYPMPNVSLPLDYSRKQEVVKSIPLKKTYKLGNYSLILNDFKIGTSKNQFSFYFNDPNTGETLRNLDMNVKTNTGEKEKPLATNLLGSRYIYVFPPFNKVPKHVTLKINDIQMIESDFFSFTVDVSHLKKTQKPLKIHRKVGELQGTGIFLDQLQYDNSGLWVQIRYKTKNANSRIHLAVEPPHFPGRNWLEDSKTPLLIEARNMKKNAYAYGGKTAAGPGPVYRFKLDSSFVDNSKKIRIVIQNIPFEINVNKMVTFAAPHK